MIAAAIYYAAGTIISEAGITSAVAKAGVHAAAGAISGGISGSINHTDVGLGMLTGGISGGISSYASGYIPKGFGYQLAGRALIGGVTGGITAEIYGGRFEQGFTSGALTGAAVYLFNELLHPILGGYDTGSSGFCVSRRFPPLQGEGQGGDGVKRFG